MAFNRCGNREMEFAQDQWCELNYLNFLWLEMMDCCLPFCILAGLVC